jgi:hypothetical protein
VSDALYAVFLGFAVVLFLVCCYYGGKVWGLLEVEATQRRARERRRHGIHLIVTNKEKK